MVESKEKLNSLLNCETITENDAANIIDASLKTYRKILSGKKELNKRQAKNLSEFMRIQEDDVSNDVSNDVSDDVSDESERETDENIKSETDSGLTEKIPATVNAVNNECRESFLKTRLRPINRAKSVLRIFLILSFVMSFITTIVAFIIYCSCKPMVPLLLFPVSLVLPLCLCCFSVKKLYKISAKGSSSDDGDFKFFSLLIFAAIIIYNISTYYYNVNTPVFLSVILASVIFPVYDVLIKKKTAKFNKTATDFLYTISAVMMFIGSFMPFNDSTMAVTEDDFSLSAYALALSVYALAVLSVGNSLFFSLLATCECSKLKRTKEAVLRVFEYQPTEKVYKSSEKIVTVISASLVTVICIAGVYAYSLVKMNQLVDELKSDYVGIKYESFDKGDYKFTKEDKTIIAETEKYTVRIPEGLSLSETDYSQKYVNEDKTVIVLLNSSDDDDDTMSFDVFEQLKNDEKSHKYAEKLEASIIKKYGFSPNTMYEFYKLASFFDVEKIDRTDRTELAAHVPLLVMYTIVNPKYSVAPVFYLAENEKIQARIILDRTKVDDGNNTFLCTIDFCKTGEPNFGSNISVYIKNGAVSEETAYKIINSIEFE